MSKEKGKVPVKSGEPGPIEEAWAPLAGLRRDMDRLFDDFFSRVSAFPFGRRAWEIEPFRPFGGVFRAAAPAVDFVERDKEYVVTAELPGLDDSDIEVKLANDVLTIKGEKKEEKEEEKGDYHVSERRYGAFQRTLRLPDDVDQEKIDAKFAKGVLTVTLPKSEEAMKKEKSIPVQTR